MNKYTYMGKPFIRNMNLVEVLLVGMFFISSTCAFASQRSQALFGVELGNMEVDSAISFMDSSELQPILFVKGTQQIFTGESWVTMDVEELTSLMMSIGEESSGLQFWTVDLEKLVMILNPLLTSLFILKSESQLTPQGSSHPEAKEEDISSGVVTLGEEARTDIFHRDIGGAVERAAMMVVPEEEATVRDLYPYPKTYFLDGYEDGYGVREKVKMITGIVDLNEVDEYWYEFYVADLGLRLSPEVQEELQKSFMAQKSRGQNKILVGMVEGGEIHRLRENSSEATREFKIGDRVLLNGQYSGNAMIGTVKKILSDGRLKIKMEEKWFPIIKEASSVSRSTTSGVDGIRLGDRVLFGADGEVKIGTIKEVFTDGRIIVRLDDKNNTLVIRMTSSVVRSTPDRIDGIGSGDRVLFETDEEPLTGLVKEVFTDGRLLIGSHGKSFISNTSSVVKGMKDRVDDIGPGDRVLFGVGSAREYNQVGTVVEAFVDGRLRIEYNGDYFIRNTSSVVKSAVPGSVDGIRSGSRVLFEVNYDDGSNETCVGNVRDIFVDGHLFLSCDNKTLILRHTSSVVKGTPHCMEDICPGDMVSTHYVDGSKVQGVVQEIFVDGRLKIGTPQNHYIIRSLSSVIKGQ